MGAHESKELKTPQFYGVPKRVETVAIHMTLDKAAWEKHRPAVRVLAPQFQASVADADTVTISYSFEIAYFGNTLAKLSAVDAICQDPDVVVSACCEELEQARILVHESLRNLNDVIQLLKADQ